MLPIVVQCPQCLRSDLNAVVQLSPSPRQLASPSRMTCPFLQCFCVGAERPIKFYTDGTHVRELDIYMTTVSNSLYYVSFDSEFYSSKTTKDPSNRIRIWYCTRQISLLDPIWLKPNQPQDGVLIRGSEVIPEATRALALLDMREPNSFGMYVLLFLSPSLLY